MEKVPLPDDEYEEEDEVPSEDDFTETKDN